MNSRRRGIDEVPTSRDNLLQIEFLHLCKRSWVKKRRRLERRRRNGNDNDVLVVTKCDQRTENVIWEGGGWRRSCMKWLRRMRKRRRVMKSGEQMRCLQGRDATSCSNISTGNDVLCLSASSLNAHPSLPKQIWWVRRRVKGLKSLVGLYCRISLLGSYFVMYAWLLFYFVTRPWSVHGYFAQVFCSFFSLCLLRVLAMM